MHDCIHNKKDCSYTLSFISGTLCIGPHVESFLPSLALTLPFCLHMRSKDEAEQDVLRGLFDKYAQACVDWVLEGVDGDELVVRPRQTVPVTALNAITQLCALLRALLGEEPRTKDAQV